ncbi:MAG: tetratricopeptide repeat protein [Candidatus Aminicenantes bacterium]|nr:tetratricopeptide repeat protein [Candidatus Aminicenantes bacterium]
MNQQTKRSHLWSALLMILFLFGASVLSLEEKTEMTLGRFQSFPSKILGEDFKYIVHLPEGYERTTGKYPVLFVLNAHMKSTFANAVATVSRLGTEMIPAMILVGLCNDTGRSRDTMPNEAGNEPGGAVLFLNFLTGEFVPFIDKTYRTKKFRILAGQSNTGLFTLYVFLTEPQAFDGFIAASPSLGWCLDLIKKRAKNLFQNGKWSGKFLYMNYGGKDYKELCVDPILEFDKYIKDAAPPKFKYHLEFLKMDGHVPLASLNNGLLWMFPDFWVCDKMKAEGLAAVDNHFEKLSQRYGFDMEAPEEVLFSMSYDLLRQKKIDESRALGQTLLKRYPYSPRGWFVLAEYHRLQKDLDKAREFYKKALEIDPEFVPAKRRLEIIERDKGPQ